VKFVFDGERISKWVFEYGGQWVPGNPAIGVEDESGVLIAAIAYDGYTGASISMHSRCDDPRRVPRKFYSLIFDYPFNQLKVKRVNGIVASSNARAMRVDEHLGFKREAVLRDYFPDGDAIIYAMYRDDCRFLRGRYALQT